LTTFSISFRQLQQQSKLADSFLRFVACIDKKAIPRDLLFQINMDGIEDELLISEALDKLANFSILQNVKTDFGSGQGYEIHSLVHLAMQTYLESAGEMDNSLAKASKVLADALPNSEYKNWAAWRVYLPHVMALLRNLVEDSEASADLCMKAGWHLIELGRYSESLRLCKRARKLYVVLFGEKFENTKTLQAMHLIGSSLRNCGRLKEAQEIEEKVLEVRRHIFGEEHPDTLCSMQNLAITYRELGGRLKEVKGIQEKVLEVRRRILGEDHPGTADALHNLALTLYGLGGLEEAISLMEKAACSYVRIYGSDHSKTKDAEQTVNNWKDEIEDDDGEDSIHVEGAEDSDEAE
jgi:tetratricopeptide (TPR) repeat protein